MKCKLIYNEVESTFDCPCHGSRFDKDGKCIVDHLIRMLKLINIDKSIYIVYTFNAEVCYGS